MRGHVAFLADDLLKGRDIASEGHEIAARYVASQFDAMGLTPAGDRNADGATGWLQRIGFQQADGSGAPVRLEKRAGRMAPTC